MGPRSVRRADANLRGVQGVPGAGLTCAARGKALPEEPTFQPYWGKLTVRNDRGGGGNVGIIRSPLPRHHLTRPSHNGPESCGGVRKGATEALTGERVGPVCSRERTSLWGADAVGGCGMPHPGRRYRETHRSPTRSETWRMRGSTMHGSREIPCSPVGIDGPAGRVGKSKDVR